MAKQIQVGGHIGWWPKVVRALATLTVGLGLFLHWKGQPLAILPIAIGALGLFVNEGSVFFLRRNSRWVRDTGNGFEWVDRRGARTILDEQITAVSFFSRDRTKTGERVSAIRNFLCWLDGDSEPLTMVNEIRVGQLDPLEALIRRIINRLVDKSRREIDAGRTISGGGWSLQKSILSVDRGAMPESIPTDRIDSIKIVDRQLCIWQTGENQASIRIPIASQNAHLLYMLLSPKLLEQDPVSPQVSGSCLGRVLFERTGKNDLLAGFLIGIGVLFSIASLLPLIVPAFGLFGVLATIGFAFLAFGLNFWLDVFCCHELGVYQRGFLIGERSLLYDEVESFTYNAEPRYNHGVYTGMLLRLKFVPGPTTGKPTIRCFAALTGVDDSLEALRDHISQIIAARMAKQLQEQQAVSWTPNLTIKESCLEYSAPALYGRKQAIQIPFAKILDYEIKNREFCLRRQGSAKPVIVEPVSEPNFFPGYFLLSFLLLPRFENTPRQGPPC